MLEVLSILEHESIPIVEKRSVGDRSLTTRQVAILAGLDSLPDRAFQWGHRSIKWSQYCGLVQLGDITLEILPKIHGKESSPGACRESLILMLRKAGLLKIHKPGAADVNLQKHTLLDIFIHDFCQQLNQQLVQGALRKYISREENIGVLKGKLLSHMQFRHNLAHKERLYCQYDELSEDIFINQTIKFTLKLLLPRARSPRIKNEITRLLYAFDNVTDRQVSSTDVEQVTLGRNEKRFHDILRLCAIFIKSLNPGTGAGNSRVFSLLFDMNQLFEAWVAAILKPLALQLGWKLKEQGPKRYMAYRADIDKSVFQMKPDICFVDRSGNPVLIVDTKWKLLATEDAKLGVSQADLYQMQAYGNRYGVPYLCLVYPQQDGCKGEYQLTLHGEHVRNLLINSVKIDQKADGEFVGRLNAFV